MLCKHYRWLLPTGKILLFMTQLKRQLLCETPLTSHCQTIAALPSLAHGIVIYLISQLDWIIDVIGFLSPVAYLSCEQIEGFNTGFLNEIINYIKGKSADDNGWSYRHGTLLGPELPDWWFGLPLTTTTNGNNYTVMICMFLICLNSWSRTYNNYSLTSVISSPLC